MIVYFVRHANAGKSVTDPQKDERRPLDSEGIEQCRTVGAALVALEAAPEVIISSPLKRAAQTATLLANEMGYEGRLVLDDALRPEAGFEEFSALLSRQRKHETIMVVGHNPNLSHFLGRMLRAAQGGSAVNLKKGAVAKVETGSRTSSLSWCLTPKVVRRLLEASAALQEASRTASSRPRTSRK
jgi:phosphohistidine phosphatase